MYRLGPAIALSGLLATRDKTDRLSEVMMIVVKSVMERWKDQENSLAEWSFSIS